MDERKDEEVEWDVENEFVKIEIEEVWWVKEESFAMVVADVERESAVERVGVEFVDPLFIEAIIAADNLAHPAAFFGKECKNEERLWISFEISWGCEEGS